MESISKFTTDNWIAIIAIAVPIILGLIKSIRIWIWKIITKTFLDRKIEVISPSFDKRFSSLNNQTKTYPFLDKKGHLSIDSLLDNHSALLKGQIDTAGQLRTANVYIMCYKINDSDGGTTLVSKKKKVTNLMDSEEVRLTLSDIIKDWNKKVSKVQTYEDKDKIEFVSRFHVYFEIIHPFLDGNGRIGRSLLEEQLTYLFSQIVDFTPDMKQYYSCMESAISGDETQLRKLIIEQVKKLNIVRS